jgi:hypothetical protein
MGYCRIREATRLLAAMLLFFGLCCECKAGSRSESQYIQRLASDLVEEIPSRLFYAEFPEIKRYKITVVAANDFPAVRNKDGNIAFNSAMLVAMDAVMQADNQASMVEDSEALGKYIYQIASSANITHSSGGDWQLWAAQLPPFVEFFRNLRASNSSNLLPEPSDYSHFRPLMLTNALGAVVVREVVGDSLRGLSSDPSFVQNAIYRKSAPVVVAANFDAVPPTAMAVYTMLKNLSNGSVAALNDIFCRESNFQRMTLGPNRNQRNLSGGGIGRAVSFSAGQRFVGQFEGCNLK